MTALVGIAAPNRDADLNTMAAKIAHRGAALSIFHPSSSTIGLLLPQHAQQPAADSIVYMAGAGRGHFAAARIEKGALSLSRGQIGFAPLYFGYDDENILLFASEVKALLPFTREISELPPGSTYLDGKIRPPQPIESGILLQLPSAEIANELRRLLDLAVRLRAETAPDYGSLLSGGLDSSVITALARQYNSRLHTFAAGVAGAPDLLYARQAADFLGCQHHERVVSLKEMLTVLPDVIYHMESFDALLTRSSILHYLASQLAKDYVPALFSGEGGDELFAGYDYLKTLSLTDLPAELEDITARLHNTALQRVDRCIQAHGIIGWVPILDPEVMAYARRIPADLKMHKGVEKWILRQAAAPLLPEGIMNRPKAKFWQGGGVSTLLAEHADQTISDGDFNHERRIQNGWLLNSKEELLYYRMFREHFGDLQQLDWMGRTKGAPVQYPPTA